VSRTGKGEKALVSLDNDGKEKVPGWGGWWVWGTEGRQGACCLFVIWAFGKKKEVLAIIACFALCSACSCVPARFSFPSLAQLHPPTDNSTKSIQKQHKEQQEVGKEKLEPQKAPSYDKSKTNKQGKPPRPPSCHPLLQPWPPPPPPAGSTPWARSAWRALCWLR